MKNTDVTIDVKIEFREGDRLLSQVELARALMRLGVEAELAATAIKDFNAALVRLADGRVITQEEIEDQEPPFRRIRL